MIDMTVFKITDQGILVPRVADWLDYIRQEVEADVNETIDWDGASKAVGMLAAIMATGLGEVSQVTQLAFSQNDRNAVRAASLDNLGSCTLTSRLTATRSLVVLVCTGVDGTGIAAGKQVRDSVTGEVWRSRADATIAGGSVSVEFEAVNLGAISAAPGNVSDIRSAVAGWTSASNPNSAIPGRNRENDAAYNLRQIADLSRDGANTALSIRANLLRVDDVQAVAVIENDLPEPNVVEGILLPKNSVGVYVYPQSSDVSYQEQIAGILWRYATSGIYQDGNVTANVLDASGTPKAVRWSWVAAEAVSITVIASLFPGVSSPDTEARIEGKINEYFSDLNVGQDVSRLELLGVIARLNQPTPLIRTVALLINASSSGDAAIDVTERAIPGAITVTAT